MMIPAGVILLLFLAAFVLSAFQYFVANPDRRLLDLRFFLMASDIILMFVYIMKLDFHTPLFSKIFLALGLFWLTTALLLLRTLPPPKH